MNESRDFESLSPNRLAERVLSIAGIEGLTISGGEPFDQDVQAMYDFLGAIRQNSNLSVMAYSGYLRAESKTAFGYMHGTD